MYEGKKDELLDVFENRNQKMPYLVTETFIYFFPTIFGLFEELERFKKDLQFVGKDSKTEWFFAEIIDF